MPLVFGLAVFLLIALPSAALAQTLTTVTTNSSGNFDTTVTIPSGTTPGTYDIVATGQAPTSTPYPPSSAPAISVDRTVVRAGETVRVFGSGFSPNTTVTLRLEFINSFTIAQATQTVTARARIIVVAPGAVLPPNFPIFPGIIRQPVPVPIPVPVAVDRDGDRGPIIVTNNNSSSSSSSAAAAAGGGGVVAVPTQVTTTTQPRTLARTGLEGLPLFAAGLASMLLGSVMLSADRRRYALQKSK